MAWKLWADWMNKFGFSWMVPPTDDIFYEFMYFGGWSKKRSKGAWQGAIFAGLWAIWLARSQQISLDQAMKFH